MNGTFQRAYADRMEQRVVEVRWGRIGMAIHPHAHLGEIVEIVGRPRDELFAGLGDDLPGIPCLGPRDLGDVGGDQIAELANELRAIGGGQPCPLWERLFGGCDRGVDLLLPAPGDLGQHGLGGRIHRLEIFLRRDRRTVDQVLYLHVRFPFIDQTTRPRRWCS
jgi:hypothetical protein